MSSEQSVAKENSYLEDEEIQYHGKEILQKYFIFTETLIFLS